MDALLAFGRAYGTAIGRRQTWIWLALVYVAIVGPTWLAARLTGRRLLDAPADGASSWRPRPPAPRTVAELRRMG